MSFGLKFVSIVSIAGVLAWAASAAPLQPSGEAQSPGFGYGYGAAKVTICHIPPGNPGNAHTITVGAPAVPAHLGHGDTLGPCPQVLGAATANTKGKKPKKNTALLSSAGAADGQSSTGKSKKQKPQKGAENASAGNKQKNKPDKAAENASVGTQEKTNNGKSKKNETPAAEGSTTQPVTTASAEPSQKKPKKEKPAQSNAQSNAHSNGVGKASAPGQLDGIGGGNGNAGGNGKGNGKKK